MQKEGDFIQIAICDDNVLFLQGFKEQIESLHLVRKIHCYAQLPALLDALEDGSRYDVVFMDIDWEQKPMGIDIAEKLYQLCPQTKIIYVTGYNDRFSQQIFLRKSNMSGYLVKPVNLDILRANLQKVQDDMECKDRPVLALASHGKPISIPYQEIIYIESMGHHVKIETVSETIVIYEKLDTVKALLPEYFVQCHKSYVVNMRKIRRFQSYNVMLDTEMIIPVSRSRYAQTKSLYFEYMGKSF